MSETGGQEVWSGLPPAVTQGGDDLTGLPTRLAFMGHLQELCVAGRGSLLLCDLDYLKLINDTLGHPAGDAAIQAVADILRDRLHPGWQAYRLGGDEFAVLAPVDAAELAGWASASMTALAARPGEPLQPTLRPPLRLSAGVIGIPPRSTPQRVLAGVDRRLYAAKRRGRGRLVGDDEAPGQGDHHQRLLERDEALGRLTTRLQAALNSAHEGSGAQTVVEVRTGPGGGLSAFLRVAERAARLLGYQTLRIQGDRGRRLRQYGAWATATLDGDPVNGSAGSALDHDLSGADLNGAAPGAERPWRLPDMLPPLDRPLALLLDCPEDFDPHTLDAIGPLRAAARVCVLGSAVPSPEPPSTGLFSMGLPSTVLADGADRRVIRLPPLSAGAVGVMGGLLCGAPLAGPVQTWLARRSGGAPAEVGRWLGALLLEARLRHEDPVRLVEPARLAAPEAGGDWQWSAARHLNRPTHHDRSYLWGHAALFQTAVNALRRGPFVVLTGPAGRGRTRLAEQLLMECAPQASGGAWAVSLAGIGCTEELLSRLAQTLLGQPADLGGLQSVGRLLARRPTLLLLDDLPPGVGSAALEQLLSFAPDTRMIITAPHALGLRGEQVLALPPLEPEVVREALRSRAPDLAAALADRAVDWVRGDPARFQDVLRVLSIDLSGGLLEGLLDRSPAHAGSAGGLPLGAAERCALATLGLFSDVFSLPWAQAVSGASPLMLAGLSQHGYLVPVGQGLYRLSGGLDLEGMGEAGPASGGQATGRQGTEQPAPSAFLRLGRRRALAELGRVLTPPAPAQYREWLARLDTAYISLRSLLTGLLRRGLPRSGLEAALVNAVVALNPYRISRTYFLDARADLEQVLRSSGPADQTSERPPALDSSALSAAQLAGVRLALARVLQHLGEYGSASALTAAVQADSRLAARQQASALLVQGRVLHRRSEYVAAHETFRQAQTLLTRSRASRRAPELLALALGGQARSLIYLDQLPQARCLNIRALEVLGPDCEPLIRALLLNTAALIDTEDRRLEAADVCLREALRLHGDHGDREGQILNRMGLAWVWLLRGEGENSVRLGRELLREAQDAAQVWEIANILLNLGHAERLCGRVETARAHYLEAGKLVQEQDAPSLHAELLGGMAACAHQQGHPDEARRLLALALHHPGANAEVRRFFAPLQETLAQAIPEKGEPHSASSTPASR